VPPSLSSVRVRVGMCVCVCVYPHYTPSHGAHPRSRRLTTLLLFGPLLNADMCSKCYRDRNSTGGVSVPVSVPPPAPLVQAALDAMSVDVPPPRAPVIIESTRAVTLPAAAAVASPGRADEGGEADAAPKKKKKIKCQVCKKKLGLLGFDCRCGHVFCTSHRHPDTHVCSVDYKEIGRDRLRRENEAVVADKVQNRI
jgi:hypothetical protein